MSAEMPAWITSVCLSINVANGRAANIAPNARSSFAATAGWYLHRARDSRKSVGLRDNRCGRAGKQIEVFAR